MDKLIWRIYKSLARSSFLLGIVFGNDLSAKTHVPTLSLPLVFPTQTSGENQSPSSLNPGAVEEEDPQLAFLKVLINRANNSEDLKELNEIKERLETFTWKTDEKLQEQITEAILSIEEKLNALDTSFQARKAYNPPQSSANKNSNSDKPANLMDLPAFLNLLQLKEQKGTLSDSKREHVAKALNEKIEQFLKSPNEKDPEKKALLNILRDPMRPPLILDENHLVLPLDASGKVEIISNKEFTRRQSISENAYRKVGLEPDKNGFPTLKGNVLDLSKLSEEELKVSKLEGHFRSKSPILLNPNQVMVPTGQGRFNIYSYQDFNQKMKETKANLRQHWGIRISDKGELSLTDPTKQDAIVRELLKDNSNLRDSLNAFNLDLADSVLQRQLVTQGAQAIMDLKKDAFNLPKDRYEVELANCKKPFLGPKELAQIREAHCQVLTSLEKRDAIEKAIEQLKDGRSRNNFLEEYKRKLKSANSTANVKMTNALQEAIRLTEKGVDPVHVPRALKEPLRKIAAINQVLAKLGKDDLEARLNLLEMKGLLYDALSQFSLQDITRDNGETTAYPFRNAREETAQQYNPLYHSLNGPKVAGDPKTYSALEFRELENELIKKFEGRVQHYIQAFEDRFPRHGTLGRAIFKKKLNEELSNELGDFRSNISAVYQEIYALSKKDPRFTRLLESKEADLNKLDQDLNKARETLFNDIRWDVIKKGAQGIATVLSLGVPSILSGAAVTVNASGATATMASFGVYANVGLRGAQLANASAIGAGVGSTVNVGLYLTDNYLRSTSDKDPTAKATWGGTLTAAATGAAMGALTPAFPNTLEAVGAFMSYQSSGNAIDAYREGKSGAAWSEAVGAFGVPLAIHGIQKLGSRKASLKSLEPTVTRGPTVDENSPVMKIAVTEERPAPPKLQEETGKRTPSSQSPPRQQQLEQTYDEGAEIGGLIKKAEADISLLRATREKIESRMKSLREESPEIDFLKRQLDLLDKQISQRQEEATKLFNDLKTQVDKISPNDYIDYASDEGFYNTVIETKARSLELNHRRGEASARVKEAEANLERSQTVQERTRGESELSLAKKNLEEVDAEFERNQWKLQLLNNAHALKKMAENGVVLLKRIEAEDFKSLLGSDFANYGIGSFLIARTNDFQGVRGVSDSSTGVGGYRTEYSAEGDPIADVLNSTTSSDTYQKVSAVPGKNIVGFVRLKEKAGNSPSLISDIRSGNFTKIGELVVQAAGPISPTGQGLTVNWGGNRYYNPNQGLGQAGGRQQYSGLRGGKKIELGNTVWVPDGNGKYVETKIPESTVVTTKDPARQNRNDITFVSSSSDLGNIKNIVVNGEPVRVPSEIRRMALDLVTDLAYYRQMVAEAAPSSYSALNPRFESTPRMETAYRSVMDQYYGNFQKGISSLQTLRKQHASASPEVKAQLDSIEKSMAIAMGAKLAEIAGVTPQNISKLDGVPSIVKDFIRGNLKPFLEGQESYFNLFRNSLDADKASPVDLSKVPSFRVVEKPQGIEFEILGTSQDFTDFKTKVESTAKRKFTDDQISELYRSHLVGASDDKSYKGHYTPEQLQEKYTIAVQGLLDRGIEENQAHQIVKDLMTQGVLGKAPPRLMRGETFPPTETERLRIGDVIDLTSQRGNTRRVIVLNKNETGLLVLETRGGPKQSYPFSQMREGKLVLPSSGYTGGEIHSPISTIPRAGLAFSPSELFTVNSFTAPLIPVGSLVALKNRLGAEQVGVFTGFNKANGIIQLITSNTRGQAVRNALRLDDLALGQIISKTFVEIPGVPEVPRARTLRENAHYNRTPNHEALPDFVRRSKEAHRIFVEWLSRWGPKESIGELLNKMQPEYSGQERSTGGKRHFRVKEQADYVEKLGFRAFKIEGQDGRVPLPGIDVDHQPIIIDNTIYSYPRLNERAVTQYEASLTKLITDYAVKMKELESLKVNSPEYRQKEDELFSTIVDFGRVSAAFRPFESGNWGLMGPMVHSLVARMGYEIRHPGFLDLVFQSADPIDLKAKFGQYIREGKRFYTDDGQDPLGGRYKAKPPPGAQPGR